MSENASMAPYEGEYETGEVAAPLARRQEAALVRPIAGTSLAAGSVQRDGILGALARARKEYGTVVKNRKADAGTRGSYSYANLADVAEAVMPALEKQGVEVSQIPSGDVLVTVLFHEQSRQWIEGSLPILKPDARGGAQALGSALTYVRRYSLVSMLGIVPEEDDDGAQGSGKKAPRLRDRVAELSTWRDTAGARLVLTAEIAERGVGDDIRDQALADFDRRVAERPRERPAA